MTAHGQVSWVVDRARSGSIDGNFMLSMLSNNRRILLNSVEMMEAG
jgi:hypothetical protein